MTTKATYERDEFIGAPSSFWDTVLLHIYVRDNAKKVYSCYSSNDKEGFFDHLTILMQKPISAITAVGNAFVMIRETLPMFTSIVNWIPPFAQALSGAGIFLSITQLFLETMGMKRVISFQTQFINSPLPESSDLKKLQKWAKHTKQIAMTFKDGFEKRNVPKQDPDVLEAIEDLDRIIYQCDRFLDLESSEEESTMIFNAMLLEVTVQKRNLKLLKKYMESAASNDVDKEKLIRRLGIQFVKNTSVKDLTARIKCLDKLTSNLSRFVSMNDSLELLEPSASETLEDFVKIDDSSQPDLEMMTDETRNQLEINGKTIENMNIQLEKREIAHGLGSASSMFMIVGLTLSILGMPHIGLPLMLIGSILGMARFLFWITYSESTGWERELNKWVDNQILTVQEVLSDIAKIFRSDGSYNPPLSNEDFSSTMVFPPQSESA